MRHIPEAVGAGVPLEITNGGNVKIDPASFADLHAPPSGADADQQQETTHQAPPGDEAVVEERQEQAEQSQSDAPPDQEETAHLQEALQADALLPVNDKDFFDHDTLVMPSTVEHKTVAAEVDAALYDAKAKWELMLQAGSYLADKGLRPYQARVAWGVARGLLKRVLVKHKTGSGKTMTMLHTLDECAKREELRTSSAPGGRGGKNGNGASTIATNGELSDSDSSSSSSSSEDGAAGSSSSYQKRIMVFYKNAHATNFLQQVLEQPTALRSRLFATQVGLRKTRPSDNLVELIAENFCRDGEGFAPECTRGCGENIFEGNALYEIFLTWQSQKREKNSDADRERELALADRRLAMARLLSARTGHEEEQSFPQKQETDPVWSSRRWRLRKGCSVKADTSSLAQQHMKKNKGGQEQVAGEESSGHEQQAAASELGGGESQTASQGTTSTTSSSPAQKKASYGTVESMLGRRQMGAHRLLVFHSVRMAVSPRGGLGTAYGGNEVNGYNVLGEIIMNRDSVLVVMDEAHAYFSDEEQDAAVRQARGEFLKLLRNAPKASLLAATATPEGDELYDVLRACEEGLKNAKNVCLHEGQELPALPTRLVDATGRPIMVGEGTTKKKLVCTKEDVEKRACLSSLHTASTYKGPKTKQTLQKLSLDGFVSTYDDVWADTTAKMLHWNDAEGAAETLAPTELLKQLEEAEKTANGKPEVGQLTGGEDITGGALLDFVSARGFAFARYGLQVATEWDGTKRFGALARLQVMVKGGMAATLENKNIANGRWNYTQVDVPLSHETAARIFTKQRDGKMAGDGNSPPTARGNKQRMGNIFSATMTPADLLHDSATLAPKFHRFVFHLLSRILEEKRRFVEDEQRAGSLCAENYAARATEALVERARRRLKMLVLVNKKEFPMDKFAEALRQVVVQNGATNRMTFPVFVLKTTQKAQQAAMDENSWNLTQRWAAAAAEMPDEPWEPKEQRFKDIEAARAQLLEDVSVLPSAAAFNEKPCGILLADQAEGTDFKNLRELHVLSPPESAKELAQFFGRGPRTNAHRDLMWTTKDECVAKLGLGGGQLEVEPSGATRTTSNSNSEPLPRELQSEMTFRAFVYGDQYQEMEEGDPLFQLLMRFHLPGKDAFYKDPVGHTATASQQAAFGAELWKYLAREIGTSADNVNKIGKVTEQEQDQGPRAQRPEVVEQPGMDGVPSVVSTTPEPAANEGGLMKRLGRRILGKTKVPSMLQLALAMKPNKKAKVVFSNKGQTPAGDERNIVRRLESLLLRKYEVEVTSKVKGEGVQKRRRPATRADQSRDGVAFIERLQAFIRTEIIDKDKKMKDMSEKERKKQYEDMYEKPMGLAKLAEGFKNLATVTKAKMKEMVKEGQVEDFTAFSSLSEAENLAIFGDHSSYKKKRRWRRRQQVVGERLQQEALLPVSDRSFFDFDTVVRNGNKQALRRRLFGKQKPEDGGDYTTYDRAAKDALMRAAGSYLIKEGLQPYQARVVWGVTEGHLKRVLVNHKTGSGKTLTMLKILDEAARKQELALLHQSQGGSGAASASDNEDSTDNSNSDGTSEVEVDILGTTSQSESFLSSGTGKKKSSTTSSRTSSNKYQQRVLIFYKNAHAKNFLQQVLEQVSALRNRLLAIQQRADNLVDLVAQNFCREGEDAECERPCGEDVLAQSELFGQYLQKYKKEKSMLSDKERSRAAAVKLLSQVAYVGHQGLTKNVVAAGDWASRRWRLRAQKGGDSCSIKADKDGKTAGYAQIKKMLRRQEMRGHRVEVVQSVRQAAGVEEGRGALAEMGGINRENVLLMIDEAHSFVSPDPGADKLVKQARQRFPDIIRQAHLPQVVFATATPESAELGDWLRACVADAAVAGGGKGGGEEGGHDAAAEMKTKFASVCVKEGQILAKSIREGVYGKTSHRCSKEDVTRRVCVSRLHQKEDSSEGAPAGRSGGLPLLGLEGFVSTYTDNWADKTADVLYWNDPTGVAETLSVSEMEKEFTNANAANAGGGASSWPLFPALSKMGLALAKAQAKRDRQHFSGGRSLASTATAAMLRKEIADGRWKYTQVYVPLPHETAARIFAKERELKRVSDHGGEDEAPGGNPTKAAHGRDTAVEEFLTDPTLAPKFHRFAYRFLSRLVEETTQFKTDMARLVTGGQKCTTKAVLAARGQRRIKMLVLVDKKQSPVDKFAAALRHLLAQEPKMKKSGGPASLPIFVLKSTPDAQKKALQATIPAEELEALEQWEVKELQKLVATRDPTAEQDEQEDEDARRADITAEKARRVRDLLLRANVLTSATQFNAIESGVLLGDQAEVGTGTDFKNLRELHILDPPTKAKELVQFFGRGPRTNAHQDLLWTEKDLCVAEAGLMAPASSTTSSGKEQLKVKERNKDPPQMMKQEIIVGGAALQDPSRPLPRQWQTEMSFRAYVYADRFLKLQINSSGAAPTERNVVFQMLMRFLLPGWNTLKTDVPSRTRSVLEAAERGFGMWRAIADGYGYTEQGDKVVLLGSSAQEVQGEFAAAAKGILPKAKAKGKAKASFLQVARAQAEDVANASDTEQPRDSSEEEDGARAPRRRATPLAELKKKTPLELKAFARSLGLRPMALSKNRNYLEMKVLFRQGNLKKKDLENYIFVKDNEKNTYTPKQSLAKLMRDEDLRQLLRDEDLGRMATKREDGKLRTKAQMKQALVSSTPRRVTRAEQGELGMRFVTDVKKILEAIIKSRIPSKKTEIAKLISQCSKAMGLDKMEEGFVELAKLRKNKQKLSRKMSRAYGLVPEDGTTSSSSEEDHDEDEPEQHDDDGDHITSTPMKQQQGRKAKAFEEESDKELRKLNEGGMHERNLKMLDTLTLAKGGSVASEEEGKDSKENHR
eukprot:g13391.t1